MAIFPHLETEEIVQVGDKFRIKADKSFASKGEASITLVEIEPEAGDGFIDVTGSSSKDYYLDWEYSGTTRSVAASVRVTTDGSPVTITKTIEVISEADDGLFSNDDDLRIHEPDIMKWVESGRNSYKDKHRRAQTLIIDWLDQQGYHDVEGDPLTKAHLLDLNSVKEWSTFLTLRIIFEGFSNAPEDMFGVKVKTYESKLAPKKNRKRFKYDFDKSGIVSNYEFSDASSSRLRRR